MIVLSMVERVARVLHVLVDDGYGWEVLQPDEHSRWLSMAEAVLEEIQDPTPGMIEAGSEACSTVPLPNTLRVAWQAMVEAAIAEGKPKDAAAERSTEYLIRNIIRGMDEKGAIGVSLDRAALEGMLDLSAAQINVEYIGGNKS